MLKENIIETRNSIDRNFMKSLICESKVIQQDINIK